MFDEGNYLLNSLINTPDIEAIEPTELTQKQHMPLKRLIELSKKSRIERSLAYEIILTRPDNLVVKEHLGKIQKLLNINPDINDISVYFNDWLDSVRFNSSSIITPE